VLTEILWHDFREMVSLLFVIHELTNEIETLGFLLYGQDLAMFFFGLTFSGSFQSLLLHI